MPPMLLSKEILYHVAEFIDPDVAVYCRLATISKNFWHVFTSDRLWRRLDVYGVGTNIYESFAKSLTENKSFELLRYAWIYSSEKSKADPVVIKSLTSNRFVWLGFLLKHTKIAPSFDGFVELMFILADLRPGCIELPIFDEDEKDIVLKVTHLHPYYLKVHQETFKKDPQVVKCAVDAPYSWNNGLKGNTLLPPVISFASQLLQQDQEIGVSALRTDPRSLDYVSQDPLRNQYNSNKQWVLWAVSFFPYQKLFYNKHADDREVFIRAFQSEITFRAEGNECRKNAMLQYASQQVREDYEVCKLAIEANVFNYEYCANNSIDLFYMTLELAAKRVKESWEERSGFVVESGRYEQKTHFQRVYHNLSQEEKLNPDLNYKLVKIYPYQITDLPREIKGYRELYIFALSQMEADYLPPEPDGFEHNLEFAKEAVKGMNFRKVDDHQHFYFFWSWLSPKDAENEDGVGTEAIRHGFHPWAIDDALMDCNYSIYMNHCKLWYENSTKEQVRYFFDFIFYNHPQLRPDSEGDVENMTYHASKMGCAYRTADPDIQDNEQLIRTAFDPYDKPVVCFPFDTIPDEVQENTDFMKELALKCGIAPKELMGVEDLALMTISKYPNFYTDISYTLQKDLDFNIKAAQANGETIMYMTPPMKRERSIIEAAKFPTESPQPYCECCFYARHNYV